MHGEPEGLSTDIKSRMKLTRYTYTSYPGTYAHADELTGAGGSFMYSASDKSDSPLSRRQRFAIASVAFSVKKLSAVVSEWWMGEKM